MQGFNGVVKQVSNDPAPTRARTSSSTSQHPGGAGRPGEVRQPLLSQKDFATPENRAFLLKLIQGSIFQRAKEMEDKKNYLGAAQATCGSPTKYPDFGVRGQGAVQRGHRIHQRG